MTVAVSPLLSELRLLVTETVGATTTETTAVASSVAPPSPSWTCMVTVRSPATLPVASKVMWRSRVATLSDVAPPIR